MRPQHLLSIARPLLGAIILWELSGSTTSMLVLPAALLACVSDFADGRLARRRDQESRAGRYVDNVCDAVFLALAFAGFALVNAWSHPLVGSAIRYSPNANWLPLIALAASFLTYVARWPLEAAGHAPASSMRGHTAGVTNYMLTILGGVAVWPGVFLSPWILDPSFVTVAALNFSAAADNYLILRRAQKAARD